MNEIKVFVMGFGAGVVSTLLCVLGCCIHGRAVRRTKTDTGATSAGTGSSTSIHEQLGDGCQQLTAEVGQLTTEVGQLAEDCGRLEESQSRATELLQKAKSILDSGNHTSGSK